MEQLELVKRTLESMEKALTISSQIYAEILKTQKSMQDELTLLQQRVKDLETHGQASIC